MRRVPQLRAQHVLGTIDAHQHAPLQRLNHDRCTISHRDLSSPLFHSMVGPDALKPCQPQEAAEVYLKALSPEVNLAQKTATVGRAVAVNAVIGPSLFAPYMPAIFSMRSAV